MVYKLKLNISYLRPNTEVWGLYKEKKTEAEKILKKFYKCKGVKKQKQK